MIFVSVSHLRQSYHNVETNPVYLVSIVECLRIHCWATVKISRRYCADYCPGDFASMVVSKYWTASSRSPVVDQHGAITGYYTDSALALHGFLRPLFSTTTTALL